MHLLIKALTSSWPFFILSSKSLNFPMLLLSSKMFSIVFRVWCIKTKNLTLKLEFNYTAMHTRRNIRVPNCSFVHYYHQNIRETILKLTLVQQYQPKKLMHKRKSKYGAKRLETKLKKKNMQCVIGQALNPNVDGSEWTKILWEKYLFDLHIEHNGKEFGKEIIKYFGSMFSVLGFLIAFGIVLCFC